MFETNLEAEVIRSIRYWSQKLAWRSKGLLDANDFQGTIGVEVYGPKMWSKIQEIWFSADPQAGRRGLRKFIERVCRNTYKDELRKQFSAKRNTGECDLSLDFEYDDDPDTEESVTLLSFITADDEEEPFNMRDIEEILTPQEYKIVLDYFVAGTSLRELVSSSKTAMGRVTRNLKLKLKNWIENAQSRPSVNRPAPRNRIAGHPPLRPDRISKENRDEWQALKIVDFYVCGHLLPEADDPSQNLRSYQNFQVPGGVHITKNYGLCPVCWDFYWRSLAKQLEEAMKWLESEK